jgi:hypothetical protein
VRGHRILHRNRMPAARRGRKPVQLDVTEQQGFIRNPTLSCHSEMAGKRVGWGGFERMRGAERPSRLRSFCEDCGRHFLRVKEVS